MKEEGHDAKFGGSDDEDMVCLIVNGVKAKGRKGTEITVLDKKIKEWSPPRAQSPSRSCKALPITLHMLGRIQSSPAALPIRRWRTGYGVPF